MAQSGYTPVLLYASSTTGHTPLATALTNSANGSEIAINILDGILFYKDNAGTVQTIASKNAAAGIFSTPVAISSGGTGQTTASAAFNALSPVTSTGDLILGNGVNSSTRLAIGLNGQVLASNGTTASWQTATGTGTVTSVSGSGGATGLTLTGGPITTSGTLTLGGILNIANGGTGVTTSTGSGNNVLSTSPTLVTPLLGTPTSGVLTTCTGYTYANLSGTVPTWNQNTTGQAGSVANSVTFNNAGTGAASGTTYNGSVAQTISYNTVGAQVAGTYVTGVTGTAPVVSSGGTTPAISMAAATTSVSGYLTSTDWTTFNNKQPAGSYLTASTGVTTFGGGTTGLTPSAGTSGAVTLAGTLAVANGGTGLTTLSGLAYGNGTSAYSAATSAQVVAVIGSTAVTNATTASTANALNTGNAYQFANSNATALGAIGQYQAIAGSGSTWYNSGWRNDGANVYLMQSAVQTTQALALTASWNTFRPFSWNLGNGSVTINGDGSGTAFGGAITATSYTGAGTGLTGTASSLSIGGNAANVTGIVAQANGGTGVTASGVCRAWVFFQGGLGTTAGTINGQFNVSSITVNGTGDYTVNFTTAMANANYSAISCSSGGNASINPCTVFTFAASASAGTTYQAPTTGSFRIALYSPRNNAAYNAPTVQCAVFD